jgi:hypothetical protein
MRINDLNISKFDQVTEKKSGKSKLIFLTKNYKNNFHRIISFRDMQPRYDVYFRKLNRRMVVEGEVVNYTFTWKTN